MVYSKKTKRFLDFKKILEKLQSNTSPVIVEGKRDTLALKKLGFNGTIIELNDGTSVLTTIERIFQNQGSSAEFIILTDWDKTGNKLAKQLISYGEACDLNPNDEFRRALSIITAKEISCIEELPSFVLALDNDDPSF
tara:strand:- start:455 stop:868 length:414 start_codon:yes stop_codon:yes gene_type:complete